MPTHRLRRGAALLAGEAGRAESSPIYVNSTTSTPKYVPAASGTTEVEIVDVSSVQTLTNKTLTAPAIVQPFNTYAVDGAITIASQTAYLTKGSAGAYTLAAPGAAGIGVRIVLTVGSAFAHVVTFTGTTLQDGTAGANTTWTAVNIEGTSLTVVGVTATKWNVESFNLGTIAP